MKTVDLIFHSPQPIYRHKIFNMAETYVYKGRFGAWGYSRPNLLGVRVNVTHIVDKVRLVAL